MVYRTFSISLRAKYGGANNSQRDHIQVIVTTRMWANAQRDGRSAEHRWRPLFNAAKFG